MKASDVAQEWSSTVNTVTIGATSDEGGTRGKKVTVGGSGCIPWMTFEGEAGNRPAIAIEVWDAAADTWPELLKQQYGDALSDPAAWAKKAVDLGADLICLRLAGTHPETGDRSPEQAVETLKSVMDTVDLPLIVWGSGSADKDNDVLPACSQAAKGENCLFGTVTEDNYRTLVASCLADGHKLLAESPLDINIAKQVNILAHDAGFPLEDIVVFPTTGALGYGFEYVYSIMERGRTAGLSGDQLLKQPVLCDVGMETWRVKESKADENALPGFGPAEKRGPIWETITSTNYLMAGAEIFVMRHPQAVANLKAAIDRLMAGVSA